MPEPPFGDAVRRVRRSVRRNAAPPLPAGSELLESIDPTTVQQDVEFTGPVKKSKSKRRQDASTLTPFDRADVFVRRHYTAGYQTASNFGTWLPYTLIPALFAAGFLEGLATGAVGALLFGVAVVSGFVSGLIQRWRQRSKQATTPVADDALAK